MWHGTRLNSGAIFFFEVLLQSENTLDVRTPWISCVVARLHAKSR